jgi:hypothetical protein
VTTLTPSTARDGLLLEKEAWTEYFNYVTKLLENEDVEVRIEVVGDKVVGEEVERLPLLSITWEKRDDQFAIGVAGRGPRYPAALWHYVEHPRFVWVHEHDGLPQAIAIEAGDGTLTLISLSRAGDGGEAG